MILELTDDKGQIQSFDGMIPEPEPGSVVLSGGPTGIAWQRHHRDGLWHRLGGGRPIPWATMLRKRNLVLVYDAPRRES